MGDTKLFVFFDFDSALTHFINSFSGQNQFADAAIMLVSTIGIQAMVVAVALQWWMRTNRLKTRHVLLSTGFSFLLALGFNQVILLFVQRLRPYDAGVTHLLVAAGGDPSFPSDHASAAFAIAFAFLFCNRPRQGIIFVICASLIALSRVYIGTHYVGDIMGGVVTASIAAFAINRVFRESSWINRLLVRFL